MYYCLRLEVCLLYIMQFCSCAVPSIRAVWMWGVCIQLLSGGLTRLDSRTPTVCIQAPVQAENTSRAPASQPPVQCHWIASHVLRPISALRLWMLEGLYAWLPVRMHLLGARRGSLECAGIRFGVNPFQVSVRFTPNLPTKILDVRGVWLSSKILMSRDGIFMSISEFPGSFEST